MRIRVVHLLVVSFIIFYGCIGSGISDRTKPNEHMAWQFDSKTNKGEWVPIDVKMPIGIKILAGFFMSHIASTILFAYLRLTKHGERTTFWRCFVKRIIFPKTFLISIAITVTGAFMFLWVTLHK